MDLERKDAKESLMEDNLGLEDQGIDTPIFVSPFRAVVGWKWKGV